MGQGAVLGTTARPFPRIKSAIKIKAICDNQSKNQSVLPNIYAIPGGEEEKGEAQQSTNKRCYALRSLQLPGAKPMPKLSLENNETGFSKLIPEISPSVYPFETMVLKSVLTQSFPCIENIPAFQNERILTDLSSYR